MKKKQRSLNQMKEDISARILAQKIPTEWVIHKYGDDYGIDFVIELFDFSDEQHSTVETLGENIFVQLKSSTRIEYCKKKVYSRRNVAKGCLVKEKDEYSEIDVAKFTLDMSDILTVQSIGMAIPILLVLVDIKTEKVFYVCLNDYIDKVLIPEDPNYMKKQTKTIYLPLDNEITNDRESLIPLRCFGKRSKMYSAFSLFNYQRNELEYLYFDEANSIETIEMISTFLNILLRQDIWTSHEFWAPIGYCHQNLKLIQDSLKQNGNEFIKTELDFMLLLDGWDRLCMLANMYEEIVREWFLPTYISYPSLSEEDVKSTDVI